MFNHLTEENLQSKDGLVAKLSKAGALPLSHSKMAKLSMCPRAYEMSYRTRAKKGTPLSSEPANVGTFIHKVLQYCIEKGSIYGYYKDIIDFDVQWFQLSKVFGLTRKEYDMAQEQRTAVEESLRKLIVMITQNDLNVFPETQVALNCAGKVVRTAKRTDKFIWGFIDLYADAKDKSKGVILDYKTHAWSEKHEADLVEQTELYALIKMLQNPKMQRVSVGGLYTPEADLRIHRVFNREEVPEMVQYFEDKLIEWADLITNCEKEGFAPRKGKLCDWCSYRSDCPALL